MPDRSPAARQALVQGFFQLYPSEAARLLDNLPPVEVLQLLQNEPISTAAEVFTYLNPDVAVFLIPQMQEAFFRQLFSTVDPTRGATLLARLEESTITARLALLPAHLAQEYRELMSYPPESAGYLMDPRVSTFLADETVGGVLERLRAFSDRRIVDVCVVDTEGRLVAVVPLQEIAVAQPTRSVGELIQSQPISIHAMAPREDVVSLLENGKLASLPVVDLDGRLLGIIRYNTLVMATAHVVSQDVQAMFGAGRDERALSNASFAVRKRLPWLVINLGTAFLAATVVGLFEDTIARITALAVFLPVVAGQSGNTGSQALAVTMRGLALREIRPRHVWRIVGKEATAGFVNGCAIAVTTSLVVYLWMNSTGLAIVIGTSMVFSMVMAAAAGAIIPMVLRALGQDPAQSSSIILTTVTDVAGFMSFLGLATLLAEILGLV